VYAYSPKRKSSTPTSTVTLQVLQMSNPVGQRELHIVDLPDTLYTNKHEWPWRLNNRRPVQTKQSPFPFLCCREFLRNAIIGLSLRRSWSAWSWIMLAPHVPDRVQMREPNSCLLLLPNYKPYIIMAATQRQRVLPTCCSHMGSWAPPMIQIVSYLTTVNSTPHTHTLCTADYLTEKAESIMQM
jgi:hypothetical protein